MSGLKVVEKDEVARRLREAREKMGLRQGDIAQRVEKDQAMISQWESGRVPQGACDVTELGLALGLRPDELYLENASSTARKPAGDEHLSQVETDCLGSIVGLLLQMRRMGIPLNVTEDFLRGFLREPLERPASDTSEFAAQPQTREAMLQAQKLVDSALTGLPGDSTLGESMDDVATRIGKIIATLPPEGLRDSSAGSRASAPASDLKTVPHTSRHKKKSRS